MATSVQEVNALPGDFGLLAPLLNNARLETDGPVGTIQMWRHLTDPMRAQIQQADPRALTEHLQHELEPQITALNAGNESEQTAQRIANIFHVIPLIDRQALTQPEIAARVTDIFTAVGKAALHSEQRQILTLGLISVIGDQPQIAKLSQSLVEALINKHQAKLGTSISSLLPPEQAPLALRFIAASTDRSIAMAAEGQSALVTDHFGLAIEAASYAYANCPEAERTSLYHRMAAIITSISNMSGMMNDEQMRNTASSLAILYQQAPEFTDITRPVIQRLIERGDTSAVTTLMKRLPPTQAQFALDGVVGALTKDIESLDKEHQVRQTERIVESIGYLKQLGIQSPVIYRSIYRAAHEVAGLLTDAMGKVTDGDCRQHLSSATAILLSNAFIRL